MDWTIPTQIAILAAIISGFSTCIIYAIMFYCKARFSRNSDESISNTSDFNQPAAPVSFSPLQQRVITKLRDRPPRYEPSQSAECRRSDHDSSSVFMINLEASSKAASCLNIPPPAYELSDKTSVRIKIELKC